MLAEPAIHDLFVNMRNQMNQSKRVQLIAAVVGLHEEVTSFGNHEHPTRHLSDASVTPAAISFYIHAIATLSNARCEVERDNEEVVVLFPATFSFKGKTENWLVPVTVARQACESILGDLILDGDPHLIPTRKNDLAVDQ